MTRLDSPYMGMYTGLVSTTHPTTQEVTMIHSIVSVEASPASGPGALDGHVALCSCGEPCRTSLSASEARRLGSQHVDYMNAKVGR